MNHSTFLGQSWTAWSSQTERDSQRPLRSINSSFALKLLILLLGQPSLPTAHTAVRIKHTRAYSPSTVSLPAYKMMREQEAPGNSQEPFAYPKPSLLITSVVSPLKLPWVSIPTCDVTQDDRSACGLANLRDCITYWVALPYIWRTTLRGDPKVSKNCPSDLLETHCWGHLLISFLA